jgi:hypothetical protein
MKHRIRYLAGLVAPAAGPALRPPRQLFDAGTYQPARSQVSEQRQRPGGYAGPNIPGAAVLHDASAGAPSALPGISLPAGEPAADRAFTASGRSRTPGLPPAAGSSLAADLVPSSASPAIVGTAPATGAPPMAAGPGSAHAAGEGTGPVKDARAVHAGLGEPGQPRAASHPAGARTEPPSAGTIPPPAPAPAPADHGPVASRATRLPSGHSWPLAGTAGAPSPGSHAAARQGEPAGLPPANESAPRAAHGPVPDAGAGPAASAGRGIVPARPGGPGVFPDLLPPPAPAPALTEPPQPEAGGWRHRPRNPQSHRVSIGTIEVTVVPPVPPAPAHRIPPPPRPIPVRSRPASQPDRSGDSRFRRWYGTAQS